ncbi:MAG: glycosyltransferase family 2 protein [Prevotella sp.]
MTNMKFTVITINYNNADGLRQTIESVVGQTYGGYEYVIIDGDSTDGSVDVIRKYKANITYWVSEKDGGIYNAMNKGVKAAHGEYLIFMNSGDFFYDNNVLSDVCINIHDEDIIIGNVLASDTRTIISPPPLNGNLTMYHLYSGAIPHQGSFVKLALQQRHPFDETLKIAADWKFFLQSIIFDNCSVKYINVNVALYDTSGLSSQNPLAMREEKEKVLEECLPQRVIDDYRHMKESECLTQALTPLLRNSYSVDRVIHKLATLLLNLKNIIK